MKIETLNSTTPHPPPILVLERFMFLSKTFQKQWNCWSISEIWQWRNCVLCLWFIYLAKICVLYQSLRFFYSLLRTSMLNMCHCS
jgi:hypothetical protein